MVSKGRAALPVVCGIGLIIAACTSAEPGASPTSVASVAVATPSPRPTPTPAPTFRALNPSATIKLSGPTSIAASHDSVWVTAFAGLARIDVLTHGVTTIPYGSGAHRYGGVALTHGAAWVTDFSGNSVYRIDPETNTVVATIPVGTWPEWIGAFQGDVWVANHRSGTVTRIDAATNKVVATIKVGPVDYGGPQGIAGGFGGVWVSVGNAGPNGTVVRIDPATNSVLASIAMPDGAFPNGNARFTEDRVWIPSGGVARAVTVIDPLTNQVVAKIDTGGFNDSPAIVDGRPWVPVGPSSPRLVRIDPATNQIDRTLRLPDRAGPSVILVADELWLLSAADGGSVIIIPVSELAD